MEFTYRSIYQLQGLSYPTDAPDLSIIDDQSSGISALVTSSNLDSHCAILDRGLACAVMTFKAQLDAVDFEVLLAEETQRIQKQRAKELTTGAFLVVDVKGSLKIEITEPIKSYDDFLLCWDAVDKDKIRAAYGEVPKSIMTALCLASGQEYEVLKITDGVYLHHTDGRILHTYTLKGGNVTVIAAKSVKSDFIDTASIYARALTSDRNLSKVVSLFSQALDKESDPLKCFISGWSALEIFVNKVFSRYESRFLDDLSSGHKAGAAQFVGRIRRVMTDKYTLVDKFALISSFLHPSSDDDIKQFKELKRLRDRIFHGDEMSDISFNNDTLRTLLAKYLRAHIDDAPTTT